MAKILNKDPATYQRERECFLRDLQQFHETRGTPFRKIPKINGHEIDLYLLYVLVTAHGGWVKVNSRNEWELLVETFCLPKHCVNSGVGLKQIYCRYLDRYEKVNYLGEDVERGSDDDEDSRHRRWSARALHSVPLTYNYHQHNVAENLRTYNGLSADLYKQTDYDRLALSLMSPLPNEQDFAINVCTLLSNEGKHTLRLDKYPRLVDFLLAHAGIYSYPGMREYFEDIYCNVRQHSLRSFWTDVIEDPVLGDLIDESRFSTKKDKNGETSCGNKNESSSSDDLSKGGTEKPGEKFPVYWADGPTKQDGVDEVMSKIVLPGKTDVNDEIIGRSGSTEDSKVCEINVVGSEKANDLSSVASSSNDKTNELPVVVGNSCTVLETSNESCSKEASLCEKNSDVELKADDLLSRTLQIGKNQEYSDNKDSDKMKSKEKCDEVCSNQRTEDVEKMEVDVPDVKSGCPVVLVEACKCDRTGMGNGDCAMEVEYEEGEDGLLQEKSAVRKSERKVQLTILPEDTELFCLWRMLGTQDYVGQRVLQIATILRNLSFVEENVPVLGRNFAFLRFLLLCARSRWNSLHQAGLDMLGNVAQEIHVEDPMIDQYSSWLVSSVSLGVSSQDRFVVLSCLEVLNKLSQREDNEDIMLKCIDQKVYDQVCQFLTLHDIMLLIYTLECLYSLSSLGERACNCIARVHGAIDTLVSLITVEAQSYGPRACILMRVVETVSGVQSTATTTTTTTTSAMAGVPSTPVTLPMTTPLRPSTPITPQRQTGSHKMVIGAPQPAVATPVSITASHQATPQQYLQQQQQQQQQFVHQQAVQENEQFALAWLRSAYEPHTGSRLEQGEVYKQYLTACAKVGRRGVIAPLHFPRCVRSVFGSNVGPIQQKPATTAGGSSGSAEQMLSFYEGIKVRANPFPIGVLQASGVAPVTQSPASRKPFPIVQHMVTIPKTVTPPPMSSMVRTTPPPPPPPSSSPSPALAPVPLTTQAPVPTTTVASTTSEPPTVSLVLDTAIPIVPAPASPILKAQLSAPPKPRDSSAKGDVKSQVLAHPHLTQALLGQGQGQGTTPIKEGGACNNSTSLIKSLLATKVTPAGDSPSPSSSMMPASVCASSNSSLQVTQRQQQQKLLQQQLQCQETCPTSPPPQTPSQPPPAQPSSQPPLQATVCKPKAIVCIASKAVVDQRRVARMNGARTPIPLQAQLDAGKEANNNGMSSTVVPETVTVVVSDSSALPRVVENHASGAGGGSAVLKGRREPPQPPPPPLVPMSSGPPRLPTPAPDDSDNSRASSSRDCSGANASTDDGENSLTSFEGFLLNGIPNSIDIDAASNDSSASKDSARSGVLVGKALQVGGKSLMLADLLEKKVDKKEPPVLNGIVGKELRIGEKGLELVENHLEKVLKESVNVSVTIETSTGEMIETTTGEVLKGMSEEGLIRLAGPILNSRSEKDNSSAVYKTVGTATDGKVSGSSDGVKCAAVQTQTMQGIKRPAEKREGDAFVLDAKRPHLESATVNGTSSPIPVITLDDTPNPKEKDNSEPVSASTTAANLYAALAASTIEDEPDLEIEPTPQIQLASRQTVFLGQGMDAAGQQLIVTAPRQIIVSQGQLTSQNQVLISAGGQLTLQQGANTKIKAPASHQQMPMLVQTGNAPSQRTQITAVTPQGAQIVQAGQVVLTQSSSGQFILSQTPPNQMQLVTGTSQGSQYIVSGGTATGQAHYVMAQPQTALVQGQSQTVLVAQTPQQQGTGAKTIIILQPQSSAAAAHHQKVMVTPQGQQVVVTQVPRPILQNPAPSLPPPALVPTSGTSVVSANTSNASTNITQTQQKQQQSQPTSLPTKVLTNTISNIQPTRLPTPTSQIIVSAATTSSATTSVIHQTPVIRPAGQIVTTSTPSLIQPRPPRPLTPTSAIRPPMSQPSVVARPAVAISSPQRVVKTYQNPRIAQAQAANSADKSVTVQHSSSPQQPKTIRPSITVQQPQIRPHAPATSVDQAVFLCEWRGCMRSFASANEVYLHACEAHCPLGSEEIQCLWERCDAMRRKRLSLMTHLYDRHCNADVLRMMAVRRRQLSQSGRSEIPPPQPPPPHPGYAPNAAFHAIKRHALEFVNPKEMMKAAPASIQARTGPSPPEQDDNEGPVTKSIRLTSSLILRNLVIYSTNGRRFLRSYEPHLASIALSNVESSRTIAQVLYDMNQQTSSQR